MTVQQQYQPNIYDANGTQATFDYTFEIRDKADLAVYLDDVRVTSGYTVGGVGNVNGGTVTLNTPPSIGTNVALYREMSYQQQTSYPVQGPFPSKSHEAALDKMALRDQQLAEIGRRSVQLPRSIKPTQFNTYLPADIMELGRRFLMTNENGNGFEMLPYEFSFDEWLDRSEAAASNAELFRNEAQQFRNQTLGYRNEVSQWRDEAEELYQVERLFYISDDDIGVLVGVGVNTLVTETTDSIVVNLKTS